MGLLLSLIGGVPKQTGDGNQIRKKNINANDWRARHLKVSAVVLCLKNLDAIGPNFGYRHHICRFDRFLLQRWDDWVLEVGALVLVEGRTCFIYDFSLYNLKIEVVYSKPCSNRRSQLPRLESAVK